MALQHVLDDGQAQAGAAGVARAAAVHAVKALGDARQVLGGDARPAVSHGQARAAARQRLPLHLDAPAGGRVAHGVVDKVGQGAVQLLRTAGHLARRAQRLGGRKDDVLRDPARALVQGAGQRARFLLAARQQRRHVGPFVHVGQRAAFQAREGQQILHQVVHARGLLGHQSQVALAFVVGQRQGLQRLDKAHQHGERRADFVRDVGDEVAAHGLGLLQRGDVARQQQQPAFAIGMQLRRHAHRVRVGAVAPRQHHVAREVARRAVGAEGRVAHQVADGLQRVALGVQAEVLLRDAVAPLDAALRVEQRHAIGRGLQRGQDAVQLRLAGRLALLALAQQAPRPVGHLAPQAAQAWRRRGIALAQPGQHARAAPRVPGQPQPRAHAGTRQGAPGAGAPPAQGRAQDLGHQERGQAQQHEPAVTIIDVANGA